MKTHRLLCPLVLVVIMAFTAIPSPVWGTGRVRLQSTYEQWSWKQKKGGAEASLNELTQRVFVGFDLSRSLSLELATGHVTASWSGYPTKGNGVADRVGGLLDTRGRLSYRVADRVVLRVGANVPTGMTGFNPEELPLAQAVADRTLGSEANRLGEGMNYDAGGSYALRVGPAAIGLGAAFLRKGEFDLTESTSKFDPGDQTSIAGGVDLQGANWMWRNNIRAILYGKDLLNGEDFGRTGTRRDVQSTLVRRRAKSSIWLTGTNVTFERGETLVGTSLQPETTRGRGAETYADLGGEWRTSEHTALMGIGSARLFSGNGWDQGKASFLGAQLGLRVRTARRFSVEFRGSYGAATLEQADPLLGNTGESPLGRVGGNIDLAMEF